MIATLALGIGEACQRSHHCQIIMTVVQTLIASLPLLLEGACSLSWLAQDFERYRF
ncbi:MAG: hypothetical protein ACLRQY_08370 [[Clostridium] leptum]